MPDRPILSDTFARTFGFLLARWKERRWTYRPERHYMRGKRRVERPGGITSAS